MKSFACILLALVCAAPLGAQRYILKNGLIFNQSDVVLRNGSLVKALAGSTQGSAEASYAIAEVARLDWPEPAEIKAATVLLASGKAVEAQEKITPICTLFAPFPKVPGSWWSDAAVVRARALLAQKKITEAASAAREIISAAANPDDVKASQLMLAEVHIHLGKSDIADAMLNSILEKHASAEIEARACLLRGDIAFANKTFDKALEFYLQVPVFHGSYTDILPAALLGSARSYKGYGDNSRAERTYLELMNTFPDSSEAAIAKTESNL